jgi:putative phage-type endonuclease
MVHFKAANVLACTEDMTHENWLAYRKLGIGGSDASVVCGINRWKSPIELFMEKSDMLPPSETGEPAYWGNRLEGLVKEEFTLRTGIEITPVKQILQSAEYPFMLANLDGICYHPEHGMVIFEAKTSSTYRSSEWMSSNGNDKGCENGDGIPAEYLIQLQHYMAVTGCKGAYIAVLIGGNDFRWQFVERDEELISMLIQLETEFWDKVQTGMPPTLDGSEASAKFLSRLYPDSVPDTTIQLPHTAMSLIKQYSRTSEKIKQYTEEKQEAENLLKQMLGDNEVGFVGNYGATDTVVSWKTFNQERLDTKTIKTEHPTLCSKYVNITTSRRFSIKSA